MSDQMLELMQDVRDRVIRIETNMEDIPEIKSDVKKHGEEILKMKTSMKLVQWFAGFIFITVPATALALVKLIKS